MKTKIKPIYWSLMLLFFVLTVTATGLVYWSGRSDIPSIFLSGIAICISILAMGLSDPRKRHFKGRVEIWAQADPLLNMFHRVEIFSVTFTVCNEDSDPVEGIAYRVSIAASYGKNLQGDRMDPNITIHEHDGFTTFTEDRMGFIHGKDYAPQNMLSMRMGLFLPTKSASHDLQVSVTGQGILPTTFVLPAAAIPDIRNTRAGKPITLYPAYQNKKHEQAL